MTTSKTNVLTIRKIKNEASKKQFKDAQARAKTKPLSTLNPKINTTLLILIQDAIKAHPKHFDMRSWYRDTDCGTAACIAGWAIQFGSFFKDTDIEHMQVKYEYPVDTSIETGARRMLGMTSNQAYRLFYSPAWIPEDRIEDWLKPEGAIEYIDQILDGKIHTFNQVED